MIDCAKSGGRGIIQPILTLHPFGAAVGRSI